MIQEFIPDEQKLLVIAASGITGTATMNLFMYFLKFFTSRVPEVEKVLGTMIICETSEDGGLSESKSAIAVGVIAHYTIGILFAYFYHLLWFFGVGEPGFWNGLLLGLVSGIFAVMFWSAFFAIHPFPPVVNLRAYIPFLFLAHFVFASVTVASYIFLEGKL